MAGLGLVVFESADELLPDLFELGAPFGVGVVCGLRGELVEFVAGEGFGFVAHGHGGVGGVAVGTVAVQQPEGHVGVWCRPGFEVMVALWLGRAGTVRWSVRDGTAPGGRALRMLAPGGWSAGRERKEVVLRDLLIALTVFVVAMYFVTRIR